MVSKAKALSIELKDLVGEDRARTLITSIRENAGPLDHKYQRFDDPRMTREDLSTICNRIQGCINDERKKVNDQADNRMPGEIESQQAKLDAMPF